MHGLSTSRFSPLHAVGKLTMSGNSHGGAEKSAKIVVTNISANTTQKHVTAVSVIASA